MKEIALFISFIILGLSLTISGIYYMKKRKGRYRGKKNISYIFNNWSFINSGNTNILYSYLI